MTHAYKLNEDVKAAWCKALREYKQPRAIRLFRALTLDGPANERYCAVGLLSTVIGNKHWAGSDQLGVDILKASTLADKAEPDLANPLDDQRMTAIFRLSDAGVSFESIAQYIEENF